MRGDFLVKRRIIVTLVMILLIFSVINIGISATAGSGNKTSSIVTKIFNKVFNANNDYIEGPVVPIQSISSNSGLTNSGDDFGVFIYTNYNGDTDEEKLTLDLTTFILMLKSGGSKDYTVSLQNTDDTTVRLSFKLRPVPVDGGMANTLETNFYIDTTCDTNGDFEIALEVRFPFSSLEKESVETDIQPDQTIIPDSIIISDPIISSIPVQSIPSQQTTVNPINNFDILPIFQSNNIVITSPINSQTPVNSQTSTIQSSPLMSIGSVQTPLIQNTATNTQATQSSQTSQSSQTTQNTNTNIQQTVVQKTTTTPLMITPSFTGFVNKILSKNAVISRLTPVAQDPVTASNGESYFSARIGYSSEEGVLAPKRVDTSFAFGRDTIFDPQVQIMHIKPYDLGNSLTFFSSYQTVDENGNEQYIRDFELKFDPAIDITIMSIPRNANIRYTFGESQGGDTTISFRAYGGILEDITQSFILNNIPMDMQFDLNILGERSFIYDSGTQSFDKVTFKVDSEQNGELVKLDLYDLPSRMEVEWGLDLSLRELRGSGFVDLEMSDNIGEISLYFKGAEKRFMTVTDFPKELRLQGSIDVPHLMGSFSISKYSGGQTTIGLPIFALENPNNPQDSFEIEGSIIINDGTGAFSFNMPDQDSTYVSLGLDTNNHAMGGFDVKVKNAGVQIAHFKLGGINADDCEVSFDTTDMDDLKDFDISGKVTKIMDLEIVVNYKGFNLDLTGSWQFGQYGLIDIDINMNFELVLDDLQIADTIQLSGGFSIKPGSTLKLSWNRGDNGNIGVETTGATIYGDVFVDLGTADFDLSGSWSSNSYIIFSWKRGETGELKLDTKGIDVEGTANLDISGVKIYIHGEWDTQGNAIVKWDRGQQGQLFIQTENIELEGSVKLGEEGSSDIYAFGEIIFSDPCVVNLQWDLDEVGEVSLYTTVIESVHVKVLYRQPGDSSYQYGFEASSPSTDIDERQFSRKIMWDATNKPLPRIWVFGDEPIPNNWDISVLWNYEWYEVI